MQRSQYQVNEIFGDFRIIFDSEDEFGTSFYLKFRKKGIQKSVNFRVGPGVNLEEFLGCLKAAEKTMEDGVTWVCKKCGEEFLGAASPEKCNECGHSNFEAWRAHFQEFAKSCGSLHVSLEEKDYEPVLILEDYTNNKEMTYQEVFGELEGLREEVENIKEDYEEIQNSDDGPAYLEDIEDIISELSKVSIDEVKEQAAEKGFSADATEKALDYLRQQGRIFEAEDGKIEITSL